MSGSEKTSGRRRYGKPLIVITALFLTFCACVSGTARRGGSSDYFEPRLISEGRIVVQCNPAECATTEIGGVIIMNVLVDTKGVVIDVEIAHASIGDPDIVREAIKAAYATRWKPAILKGSAVNAWAQYQLEID